MEFVDIIDKLSEEYDKVILFDESEAASMCVMKSCTFCGSNNGKYVYINSYQKHWHAVKRFCLDCGHTEFTMMTKNATARTNSKQYNWSEKVKQRDGYKCRICFSDIEIHAHHVIPVSVDESKRYDINNGVCLCKSCHVIIHRYMNLPEVTP